MGISNSVNGLLPPAQVCALQKLLEALGRQERSHSSDGQIGPEGTPVQGAWGGGGGIRDGRPEAPGNSLLLGFQIKFSIHLPS
jgi:hypothetical protein